MILSVLLQQLQTTPSLGGIMNSKNPNAPPDGPLNDR
jgi:hypothetical protein